MSITLAAVATSSYYFPCKSILHFRSAGISKTESVIVLLLTWKNAIYII